MLKECDNSNAKYTFISTNDLGMPHIEDLCWLSGFDWKGVYIKIIPEHQSKFIIDEIKALNYLFFEYIQIIENYKFKDFDNKENKNLLSNEIIFPLISYAKFNGLILLCSNIINLYSYDLRESDRDSKGFNNSKSKSNFNLGDGASNNNAYNNFNNYYSNNLRFSSTLNNNNINNNYYINKKTNFNNENCNDNSRKNSNIFATNDNNIYITNNFHSNNNNDNHEK